MSSIEIRIGLRPDRIDVLRKGSVRVHSPRGLAAAEALAVEALGTGEAGEILVIGGRDGIVAEAAARLNPAARVCDWHVDSFPAERAAERLSGIDDLSARVRVEVDADPPDLSGRCTSAVVLLSRHGAADWASEMIASGAANLAPGGRLIATVDNPMDRFVRERMKKIFGALSAEVARGGQCVIARATKAIRRRKQWVSEFTIGDAGEALVFSSRPGVFAAGRLDDGARALIAETKPRDGDRVLDLGCGLGVAGIMAGRRANLQRLVLLDSNARAAALAGMNAARVLGPRGTPYEVQVHHDAARVLAARSFDLVLANPPYFADLRVAELFARAAARLLDVAGRYVVVTKQEERHRELLAPLFHDVESRRRGEYAVLHAERPLPGR